MKKIETINNRLNSSYPPIDTSLDYNTPFQLLIATILSAQCTDEVVNRTTKILFKEYSEPEQFANANIAKLKKIIKPTGYYSLKANRIKNTSKRIVRIFDSRVPDNMEDLLTLDGVGRKTANIVLSVAFKKTEGIAVDTHVKRLSNRLGLTNNSNPEKIEIDLMNNLKKDNWDRFSILLILHGRKVCQARKPDCDNCILNDLCPYYKSIRK
tara:strand:- start:7244 stop:7876 length:633 start_codon:yes stop_codon:yes gene_type:complete